MSSSNNDNSGAALAFGLIVAGLYVLALFFAIALVALAIGGTVLAIMAWNRPIRIRKKIITPEEARDFVRRGVIGLWAAPMLLALGDIVLGWQVNWSYLFYFMLFGYVAGSVGLELLLGDEERSGPLVEYLPPENTARQEVLPPPQGVRQRQATEAEPFRFASWDDEER